MHNRNGRSCEKSRQHPSIEPTIGAAVIDRTPRLSRGTYWKCVRSPGVCFSRVLSNTPNYCCKYRRIKDTSAADCPVRLLIPAPTLSAAFGDTTLGIRLLYHTRNNSSSFFFCKTVGDTALPTFLVDAPGSQNSKFKSLMYPWLTNS